MALILKLLAEKDQPAAPKTGEYVTEGVKCSNPRCISTVEQELPQVFKITDAAKGECRCIYCDHKEQF
jgi:aspartate carbamoyltransferase regulatory subunit